MKNLYLRKFYNHGDRGDMRVELTTDYTPHRGLNRIDISGLPLDADRGTYRIVSAKFKLEKVV